MEEIVRELRVLGIKVIINNWLPKPILKNDITIMKEVNDMYDVKNAAQLNELIMIKGMIFMSELHGELYDYKIITFSACGGFHPPVASCCQWLIDRR